MERPLHPLRAWRRANGNKTLAAVAALLDGKVTPSHLSEIENWNNAPSLALAERLQSMTGIEMKEFVKPRECIQ